MAKNNEYGFKLFFTYEDGHSVPWEDISAEEKRNINRKWVERWEEIARTELPKNPDAFRSAAEAVTEEDIRDYYELFPERYEEDKKKRKVITVETNRQFNVAN